MSRQSTTSPGGVFSSRVITNQLLSRGQSELLEARRAVAAWAFAPGDKARPARQNRPDHSPQSTPVISVQPLRLMVSVASSAPGILHTSSSFTYANGTFSVGDRRVLLHRSRRAA